MKPWLVLAVAVALCLSGPGCQSDGTLRRDDRPTLMDQPVAVRYSVIYLIHGDGSYLYHDSDSRPHAADKRILGQALQVARETRGGEVFIFHQKPKRRLLFCSGYGEPPFQALFREAPRRGADYIIASPENLHLSHIDTRAFADLSPAREQDIHDFARNLARTAFCKLTENTRTAVTLSLYDVEKTGRFLQQVEPCHSPLDMRAGEDGRFENDDCSDCCGVFPETAGDGVEVFYRPPRFGREKNNEYHSGWGCRRESQLASE